MFDVDSMEAEFNRVIKKMEKSVSEMKRQIARNPSQHNQFDIEFYDSRKDDVQEDVMGKALLKKMKHTMGLLDSDMQKAIRGVSGSGSFRVPTGSRPSLYGVPTVGDQEQDRPEMALLRQMMNSEPDVEDPPPALVQSAMGVLTDMLHKQLRRP